VALHVGVVHHIVGVVEVAVLAEEEELAVEDGIERPAHLQVADVQGPATCRSLRVQGAGCNKGSGLGFGVMGLGFGVWGLGFGV